MIPNNNLSVLPFYDSTEDQNARKWWAYGRVYPLFTPAGFLLPFQIITEHTNLTPNNITGATIYDANTHAQIAGITSEIRSGITKKEFASLGYDVWVFPGHCPC